MHYSKVICAAALCVGGLCGCSTEPTNVHDGPWALTFRNVIQVCDIDTYFADVTVSGSHMSYIDNCSNYNGPYAYRLLLDVTISDDGDLQGSYTFSDLACPTCVIGSPISDVLHGGRCSTTACSADGPGTGFGFSHLSMVRIDTLIHVAARTPSAHSPEPAVP